MIDRINLILKAKNITAKQFAEEIGVQPSGMSHILSGRNNPSLEFVMKVVRRYPEIDINWLLMGKGEMYKGDGLLPASSPKEDGMAGGGHTLFSDVDDDPFADIQPVYRGPVDDVPTYREETKETPRPVAEVPVEAEKPLVEERPAAEETSLEEVKAAMQTREGRRLVKILFFYDDRTFEEYRPE